MQFDEIYKEDLSRAMVNGSWLLLQDVLTPEFGWDLPVYYLQYCADKQVGYPLGNLSYELIHAEQIVDINYYIEELNKFLRRKIKYASILLSFASESTPNKSIDKDIILWQALGKSKIKMQLDSSILTSKLEQGDLVYLPASEKYEILPETARATIAFYLEEEEKSDEDSDSTTA